MVSPVRVKRQLPASGPDSDALASGAVTLTCGTAGPAAAVMVKSSTARPSSAPLALKSVQRIQIVAPLVSDRPVRLLLSAWKLPAALPSRGPADPALDGVPKSSASTSTQVPSVNEVAFRLYWKSSRSVRLTVPSRQNSPTYEMSSELSEPPVALTKLAPKAGVRLPDSSVPSARSLAPAAPKL